jgi:hypothetical protein
MRHARCLLALAVWTLASCNGATVPTNSLDGHWVAVDELPGFGLSLVFATTNGAISGSGTWAGEAIVGGDVMATGVIERGNVTLDLTYNHVYEGAPIGDTFTKHFAGRLTSHDNLEGTVSTNGLDAGTLHLRRSPGP